MIFLCIDIKIIMSNEKDGGINLKILLDAMGGDNAPDAVIKGAIRAAKEIEADIVLIGNEEIINSRIKEIYGKNNISEITEKVTIKHTTEQIEMQDTPTIAIKHKKDSSMVVGFKMLKEEEGDVFISAGNSGALLTGATLLVGRIRGIDRPAIAPILPAYKKSIMLMDAGANTNCKPINLVQFAQMSTIYLKNTFGIESPKIGLLNIGTEEIDAVITDGFTGNVFLKTIEGIGKLVKRNLTESLKRNVFTTICAIPCMPAIKRFAKTMDYKEYGGALFLGVKRPVVKAHGSSDEYLFYFTIKQAENFVKSNAVEKMKQEFEKN